MFIDFCLSNQNLVTNFEMRFIGNTAFICIRISLFLSLTISFANFAVLAYAIICVSSFPGVGSESIAPSPTGDAST